MESNFDYYKLELSRRTKRSRETKVPFRSTAKRLAAIKFVEIHNYFFRQIHSKILPLRQFSSELAPY